jgi:4-amino-4-deoxy-L-arabinose transferase-like glycosyltransferase
MLDSEKLKWQRCLVLAATFILLFLTGMELYRPGMDSMTYGTLAKNILSTGDWSTLHYHDQAYSDFYQHPPFTIWVLALVFKLFGTGDWVLKTTGSAIGALCALGVYSWAKRMRGEWFAFIATFILLTSTRFAKYSKGFLLDPFLAAFSVWALYALLIVLTREKNSSKDPLLVSVSGILIACAFLSKGAFALAPLFVALLIMCWGFFNPRAQHTRTLFHILIFFSSLSFTLWLWIHFGNGLHYLERYWIESVSGRVRSEGEMINWGACLNLLKTYWPWLPFLFVGAFKALRSKLQNPWERTALLMSATFLGGLSLTGLFLEHYLVTFYPFAAVIVAAGIPAFSEERKLKFLNGLSVFLFVAAVLMAIFPTLVHKPDWKNPLRNTLKDAAISCTSPTIKRIAISTSLSELWLSLAMGGWHTNWDTWSGPGSQSPAVSKSDLLVAHTNEAVDSDWVATDIRNDFVQLYRRRSTEECKATQ